MPRQSTSATRRGSGGDVWRPAATAACWLFIATGSIAFTFFLIAHPTRWLWLHPAYDTEPKLITWRDGLSLQDVRVNATTGATEPLLPGSTAFILLWQWCGTLAVVLGAAGLRWLALRRDLAAAATTAKAKAQPDDSAATPSENNSGRPARSATTASPFAAVQKAVTRARRLLSWRVPPRDLWRTLLGPGGLSLLDLILILIWFGVHIGWLHEVTMKTLDRRRMAPPPPLSAAEAADLAETLAQIARRKHGDVDVRRHRLLLQQPHLLPGDHTTTAAGAPFDATAAADGLLAADVAPSPPLRPLTHVIHERVAKAGWTGHNDILLLFFPLPRCNFLHWLLGSDFPALVKYHRWLGQATVLLYTIHGVVFLATWARDGVLSQMLTWGMAGELNRLAGLVALCGAWLLWASALPFVRRRIFNAFYSCHICGAIVFLLFGFMHHKDLATWVMAGILLYLLDVVLRTLQQNFNCVRLSAAADHPGCAATARVSPDGGVLSLSIRCHQSLRWVGSDLVFLNVPAVSWWQWHPFTLASAPSPAGDDGSEHRMELRIKKCSRWTKALVSRLSSDSVPVTLYVSGPYDSGNRKWITGFDKHIFVAGGLGVTPALGMIAELIAFRRASAATAAASGGQPESAAPQHPRPAPGRAVLIWISRTMDELNALPYEILQEAGRGEDSCIDLRLFLTRGGTAKQPTPTSTAAATTAAAATAAVTITTTAPATAAPPASGDAKRGGGAQGDSQMLSFRFGSSSGIIVPNSVRPSGDGVLMVMAELEEQATGLSATENAAAAACQLRARLLAHPYMFSPLLWMAAVLLCFGGAFAGLLVSRAYDAHMHRTAAAPQNLAYVGMLQFVALGLGATLPPGLLMLAIHLLHRRLSLLRRPTPTGCKSNPNAAAGAKTSLKRMNTSSLTAADSLSGSSISGAGNSVALSAATSGALSAKNFSAAATKGVEEVAPLESYISCGRPDLKALLEQLSRTGDIISGGDDAAAPRKGSDVTSAGGKVAPTCAGSDSSGSAASDAGSPVAAAAAAAHSSAVEDLNVVVFAAGPEPMVASVAELCSELNGVWGRRGRAYLTFQATTHEL